MFIFFPTKKEEKTTAAKSLSEESSQKKSDYHVKEEIYNVDPRVHRNAQPLQTSGGNHQCRGEGKSAGTDFVHGRSREGVSRRFPTTTMLIVFFLLIIVFPFFFWRKKTSGQGSRREGGATPTKKTSAFSRNSRKGKESSRTNGVGLVGSRSRARRRRREEGVGLIPLFFFKRESAFEEWLTPQKRELFFEDFFPLFLFLAKRVVASTIERKARESSEGGFRMNDVVRIVSRVLDDDDDDDDDGALVHEMDNG